jgi:hypothetical protein
VTGGGLPDGCLRCGSDRLTWTLSCNELAHVACANCRDEYRVSPRVDGWTMVGSRHQAQLDFDDFVRRQGRNGLRRAEHEADLIDPR